MGGGKNNSVRDNHIKLLGQWSNAKATKSDKSQWSVSFRTRTARFVFYIILPDEFPEMAPKFQFQTPVEHPWVDSHDGRTILNESLLQWNPHCDITRIGKACVHEFVANPPKLRRAVSTQVLPALDRGNIKLNPGMRSASSLQPVANGQLALVYRQKPFGLKLQPKNKLKETGAVVHSLENFHSPNGLKAGMWLVTIGSRDVEKMRFKHIVKLLGEVSVPVQLVFDGRIPIVFSESRSLPQPEKSYNYGMPVYQQPAKPAPVAAAAVPVNYPVQYQKQPKPETSVKDDIGLPDIPNNAFDVLDKYNINQLEDLLSDDLALEQLAIDIANKDLNRMRKKLRDDTRTAANKNLSFKEPIEASRVELEKLRKEVEELQSANRTLYEEKQRLAPKIDKYQVKKVFEEAAEKADEESQELVDKFENDDIAYVTFIKKYKASRESHHEYMMTKGLIA